MDSPEGDRGSRVWDGVEKHVDSLVGPGSGLDLRGQAERIRTLIRAFYAYVLYLAFPWASAASAAWTSRDRASAKVHVDIAGFVPVDHWDSARVLGCAVLVLGSVLLCIQPRLRWARIVVGVAFLVTTAIQFDMSGKIEHGNHPALWMAIALCFLSSDRGTAPALRRFVTSFFGVQVLVCTLYTSAGICKLIGTFYDGPDGLTWFHPDALPYMITGNWQRSSATLLGGFLVLHPGFSALCQLAAFVLELGALPAVFFRHLQRPWAIALIILHVMILHSMKIHFHQSCFVLVLALVASPFAPSFRSSLSAVSATIQKWRSGVETRSVGETALELDRSRAARWARFWGPTVAAAYLLLAFSRFQPSKGAFRPELYPVSPMAMFFRLHPTAAGLKKVEKLRARLERDGVFPERSKRGQAKRSKARPK